MIKIISSPITLVTLLMLYIIALAGATFVEATYSTLAARTYIYTSWWFMLLQVALMVNFVALALRARLWQQKKWGALLLHIAFGVILAGALITHILGREGIMHIRQGEETRTLYNTQGEVIGELPFAVKLIDFRLQRYPGSGSPSSFESDLHIDGVPTSIYMNNIGTRGGYRFYQSSYDRDEQGTVLSVNQDSLGTTVTYIGYLLLLVGLILALTHRHSHFRILLRRLSVVVLCILPAALSAQQSATDLARTAVEYAQRQAIPASVADDFGRLLVQTPQGRITPVDTYAREVVRKLARTETLYNLSAEQILLGIVVMPEIWSYVPLIRHDGGLIPFADVLDSAGDYRYAERVAAIYEKPVNERNKQDKDLLKLDERINIFHALYSGEMLALFPHAEDTAHRWYSPGDDLSAFSGQDSMFVSRIFVWLSNELRNPQPSLKPSEIVSMISAYQSAKSTLNLDPQKITAELLYNRISPFTWAAFGYMTVGLLLLLFALLRIFCRRRIFVVSVGICSVLALSLFLFHTGGIVLRWYVSGYAPLSNAYESMIYVGWATALAGLLFIRRSPVTLALATLFAGVILFVSNLNFMDPTITPLVPVLNSYWLMIHVAVITASYGFFGIGFLLGVVMLLLLSLKGTHVEQQIKELHIITQLALTIGLVLLTAGIFLGAVWANESWGRYWGWDPKETWALVSMVVYALILHVRFIPQLRSPFVFALLTVVGFAAILMTYFGVNYYLVGLHSYGAVETPPALTSIYVVYVVVFLLACVAYFRRK